MKLDNEAKAALKTCGIPERMHGGIIRFYENGIPPGHFLSAVIDNDLKEAMGRADSENRNLIWNYVQWFYNWAPGGTWGRDGSVERWCDLFHSKDEFELVPE